MRKTIFRKTIFAALAVGTMLATPAFAAPNRYYNGPAYAGPEGAEVATGVVGGTVVGLGLTEGWWGAAPAIGSAALPTTAAGAAAVGGVAGIGAIAALDAVTEPCRGLQALFGMNHGACVDGHYVGYGPHRTVYRR
jgi:hypothetical protein